MKNLKINLEIRLVSKMANDPDAVLFTEGNELKRIYNKRTKKFYKVKNYLLIER